MDWQTIREKYPGQWLIVEAFDAFTKEGQRIIPQLKVVQAFADDVDTAWAHYKALHRDDSNREYYVLHTDREQLNIGVFDTFGRTVTE